MTSSRLPETTPQIRMCGTSRTASYSQVRDIEDFSLCPIRPPRVEYPEALQEMRTPNTYPKNSLVPQDQEGSKGLDANLKAQANWTQLGFWDDEGTKPFLQEYEGRGLLKDKAVLITGGDDTVRYSDNLMYDMTSNTERHSE